MRLVLSTLFMLALTWGAFAAPQLPESLQHLTELAEEEGELVKVARTYHRQQLDLNEMDRQSIVGYREGDLSTMELMLLEKIEKRNQSVKIVWEYVLSIYPRNPRAMTYYGEYWYDTEGNPMAGLRYWKEALMIDDELALLHNNLGLHYTHFGEPKKGHIHYQRALKLEPKNPDFLFNLAQLYLTQFPVLAKELTIDEKDVYLKAMEFSKDAALYAPDDFSLQKDYATNFYAGENFGVEVEWEKAAEAWQATYALAKKRNERFYARLNEGRCWMFARKSEEAITALLAARSINPDSRVANDMLSKLKRDMPTQKPKSVGGKRTSGRKKVN